MRACKAFTVMGQDKPEKPQNFLLVHIYDYCMKHEHFVPMIRANQSLLRGAQRFIHLFVKTVFNCFTEKRRITESEWIQVNPARFRQTD